MCYNLLFIQVASIVSSSIQPLQSFFTRVSKKLYLLVYYFICYDEISAMHLHKFQLQNSAYEFAAIFREKNQFGWETHMVAESCQ